MTSASPRKMWLKEWKTQHLLARLYTCLSRSWNQNHTHLSAIYGPLDSFSMSFYMEGLLGLHIQSSNWSKISRLSHLFWATTWSHKQGIFWHAVSKFMRRIECHGMRYSCTPFFKDISISMLSKISSLRTSWRWSWLSWGSKSTPKTWIWIASWKDSASKV